MYKKLTNDTYQRAAKTHEYVWWNDGFSDSELLDIQRFCERDCLEDSTTIGSASKDEVERVRKSKVKFFQRNTDTAWVFDRFNHIITELNESYYNFNLNGYNSFQYTVYESGVKGKYDWHMDTTLGNSLDAVSFDARETRKLTVVMLLNEPNVDFCGGEFQFYCGGDIDNLITPEMTKGKIICFPSFLIHRVKPVILGVRKSIVIWVTGPKFI